MTVEEVLAELEALATPSTKKTLTRHGAKGPFFGVKIEDMKKKLLKHVKPDHELALALYETGNSDAMYLAGLAIDAEKMKKADLKRWVKGAYWNMLSGYTVPGVAAESKYARELGLEWIKSKDEQIANAGWSTLALWASITPDEELPLDELAELLERVPNEIGKVKNRVRYAMNNFVIAVGGAVAPLNKLATSIAKKLGKVEVDMGDTDCKVPLATEYIEKIRKMGRIGKKRASARC